MTSVAPSTRPLFLADRVVPRSLVTDVLLVIGGTALVAAFAQLTIPMWPVPITGQTFAVLLVGASLGTVRGASSLALYLVLGLIGLPVYAPQENGSHLTGAAAAAAPSFGYIVGFVFAAALVGWLSSRKWDRRVLTTFLSFSLGSIVIYVFGVAGLMLTLGLTLTQAFMVGVLPFLIGDAIKALLAAGVLPGTWKLLGRNEKKPQPTN